MGREFENIIFKKEESVALIAINRPKVRNALNGPTFQDLSDAFEECRVDNEIRAVVVTGVGKAFSAGIDLTMFVGRESGAPARAGVDWQRMVNSIEELRKPVIAGVNGYAFGAGLEVALACDLRIASEDAVLGDLHARVGLVPDLGGSQRLPRLVGIAKAKEIIFTGDTIDAREAERIGLVNKVVPKEQLEAEVMGLAKRLAKGPTVAIGLTKMAINRSTETDVRAGMEFEMWAQRLCFQTEDAKEGPKAFVEKREPQFKGR